MKKKYVKEENKRLQVYNQNLRMMLNATLPALQMFPPNGESNEGVQDDKYRQEAYAKVQEWVSEFLKEEVDKIQGDYSQLLDKERKTLKRYERKISEYSSEVRFLKREIKRMNKKIMLLEDENKNIKTILKRIGFCAGVAAPGASLKEVSKGFKRESRRKYEYGLPAKKGKGKNIPFSEYGGAIDVEYREV